MTTPQKRFSIGKFLFLVALQFSLLLLGLSWLFPKTWAVQINAGLVSFVLVFLGAHLFNCFFEWAFHRYVLHVTVVRWLHTFNVDHTHHHDLTNISLIRNRTGAGRIVLNVYPIEKEEQFEASAFPSYALCGFWAVFTAPFIGLQLLLPHAPILLGGYAALTFSMVSYEVFHAVEHYPYEWWQRAIEHPRFGSVWRNVYAFHHFHHYNRNTNEAISGFFGLPIADVVFRTFSLPKRLLLNDRIATVEEFQVKPPWQFVQRIDTWARKRQAKLRQAA